MPKFSLVVIDELSGVNLIQKLKIGDRCPFDEFCEEIKNEASYQDQLDTIQLYFSKLGNNEDIPAKKFQELKFRKKNDPVKDYELRTGDLRVYCIKGTNRNKIIILGGKKSNQKKDIKKLRLIKLEFLKETENEK